MTKYGLFGCVETSVYQDKDTLKRNGGGMGKMSTEGLAYYDPRKRGSDSAGVGGCSQL